MELKWHIFLWFLPAVLVLPPSEGTRAGHIKPLLSGGSFSLSIGIGIPKPKARVVPDSALKNQNSFCQEGCRDGWISYMGHCYMYVQEQQPWPKAESTCQSLVPGGHLTSISSAEHNNFLVKLAIHLKQKPTLYWIGGSHQRGSSLQWTDGAKPNFLQRPLSSLLHSAGSTIQQILNLNVRVCLQISLRGQWDGTNCQKKLPFICSYKPDLTPP